MEAPKRKHIRLKNYDYSQNGAYFVTICTKGRQCLLSEIVRPQMVGEESVGRGLAPAAPAFPLGEGVESGLRQMQRRSRFKKILIFLMYCT